MTYRVDPDIIANHRPMLWDASPAYVADRVAAKTTPTDVTLAAAIVGAADEGQRAMASEAVRRTEFDTTEDIGAFVLAAAYWIVRHAAETALTRAAV